MTNNKPVQKLDALSLAVFFSQLSLLLDGGISVSESLAFMAEEQPAVYLREVVEQVEQGEKLTGAINASGLFPAFVVAMINIGERSGRLDEVCRYLSSFYQNVADHNRNFVNALAYPLVMAILVLIVIGIILSQILPLFGQVFALVGAQLSPLAINLMNLGQLLADNLYVIGIIAGVLTVIYLLWRFTPLKQPLTMVVFSITPGLKKLSYQRDMLVFTNGLHLMLKSGINIDEAVQLASHLSVNPLLVQRQKMLLNDMEAGISFPQALQSSQLYSKLEARIISSGVKTGAIDNALGKVSAMQEDRTNRLISQWISMIEPALVAVLTVIVGLILLAVMLPLIGILSVMVG